MHMQLYNHPCQVPQVELLLAKRRGLRAVSTEGVRRPVGKTDRVEDSGTSLWQSVWGAGHPRLPRGKAVAPACPLLRVSHLRCHVKPAAFLE